MANQGPVEMVRLGHLHRSAGLLVSARPSGEGVGCGRFMVQTVEASSIEYPRVFRPFSSTACARFRPRPGLLSAVIDDLFRSRFDRRGSGIS
jgi:hypothetical protein